MTKPQTPKPRQKPKQHHNLRMSIRATGRPRHDITPRPISLARIPSLEKPDDEFRERGAQPP